MGPAYVILIIIAYALMSHLYIHAAISSWVMPKI